MPEWSSELLIRQFKSVHESLVAASTLLKAWDGHLRVDERTSTSQPPGCPHHETERKTLFQHHKVRNTHDRWHLTFSSTQIGCKPWLRQGESGGLARGADNWLKSYREGFTLMKKAEKDLLNRGKKQQRSREDQKLYSICGELTAVLPSIGNGRGWGCGEGKIQFWTILTESLKI